MSLNAHHGKFDYAGPAMVVTSASWAVHHLSDALWRELRGRHDAARAAWSADRCARQCWEERVKSVPRDSYGSACECVEMVLS